MEDSQSLDLYNELALVSAHSHFVSGVLYPPPLITAAPRMGGSMLTLLYEPGPLDTLPDGLVVAQARVGHEGLVQPGPEVGFVALGVVLPQVEELCAQEDPSGVQVNWFLTYMPFLKNVAVAGDETGRFRKGRRTFV